MPLTNLTFREPLQTAVRHALAHIENLEALPVAATASLETLRARLARPPMDEGAPPAQVIEDLVSNSAGGILASAGGASTVGWSAAVFPRPSRPTGSPPHGTRTRAYTTPGQAPRWWKRSPASGLRNC